MTDSELCELRWLAVRDARARLLRCVGKPRFENREVARRALSGSVRAAHAHPYCCGFCGWWHIGTTIAPRGFGSGRNAERKNASHGGHA